MGNTPTRGIRIPADLEKVIKEYGEWLAKEGFMPEFNLSQTVLFIIRRAEVKGELQVPPPWFKKGS